ncbi:MAG: large conductance mechanosensitive channel protein MscL [Lachnospiraceae bacterium]|nr:large conductance mechanosensitive channel protein MscL [Lachnospiraceae bacterium]
MKKLIEEFKKFAFKGNVIDMAVAVVIGAAFTAIVNSLVNDIISPLIGLIVSKDFSELTVNVGGVNIAYGSFIMAVINFFIVALVMFILVKSVNRVTNIGKKKEEKAPTTKKCPFCQSEIHIDAVRCPNCTSELDK